MSVRTWIIDLLGGKVEDKTLDDHQLQEWLSEPPADMVNTAQEPLPEDFIQPLPITKASIEETEKGQATLRGEPYVKIISFDLDPNDTGAGRFELDWNEFFVAKLIRAGFKGETDEKIVDQWFTTVCRNIALELYEQIQADPTNRDYVQRKPLGNNRTAIG